MPTLHAFKGTFAYELQVGKIVVQLPFKQYRKGQDGNWSRVLVWRDPYGKWL